MNLDENISIVKEKPAIFLEGELVYLRPLDYEDISGDYQYWLNDKNICKLNQHHRYPVTKDELEDFIKNTRADKNSIVLAVVQKSNNQHIGNVCLQKINFINRTAEIASIIAQKTANGFLCTLESMKLITAHGFNEINLNRIYGGTPTEHAVILKIVEMLGYSLEGISRQAIYKNGKYLDVQNYSILREEFLKNELYK